MLEQVQSPTREDPLVEIIVEVVAAQYWTTPAEIFSYGRAKLAAEARNMVAYVAQRYGLSYPMLAQAMHRADHTTPMSAVRSFQKKLSTDVRTRLLLTKVEAELQRRLGDTHPIAGDARLLSFPHEALERISSLLQAAIDELRIVRQLGTPGQVILSRPQTQLEESDDNRPGWKKRGPQWAYVQRRYGQGHCRRCTDRRSTSGKDGIGRSDEAISAEDIRFHL